jgi:hypothetical protein
MVVTTLGLLRTVRLLTPSQSTLLRWMSYYVAKFALAHGVKRYGATRLYRRVAESSGRLTSSPEQRLAFLGALKGAIRAPSRGYALLMQYDQLLWRWLQEQSTTR